MSKMKSRVVMLAALLTAPGLVLAAPEAETNDSAAQAQSLQIGEINVDGKATTGAIIDGAIGTVTGADALDVDYFVFEGKEGDTVTFDIDGGMKTSGKKVDTILGLYGPGPTFPFMTQKDDAGMPLDAGSISGLDARLDGIRLPKSGTYLVGVSSTPRRFATTAGGGTVTVAKPLGTNANGSYKLTISGVTLSVMQISIEIKPGSGDVAPINPKSKGKIPVALLGSSELIVDDVDTASLTFGHSGNEASLSKCGPASDVNGDAFPDMVCHFENQEAQFAASDEEAILHGQLHGGRRFEGRGWLKLVPVKAQE